MVWKHLDKDDDRWLYLPALDVQKRIAATDKRTSFVGSHFFYEDVSGRRLSDDRHELVEVTDTYYVMKNTPKEPGAGRVRLVHDVDPQGVLHPGRGQVREGRRGLPGGEDPGRQGAPGLQDGDQVADDRPENRRSTTMEYSSVEYDVGLDRRPVHHLSAPLRIPQVRWNSCACSEHLVP